MLPGVRRIRHFDTMVRHCRDLDAAFIASPVQVNVTQVEAYRAGNFCGIVEISTMSASAAIDL
ncbi:MAG: hypothetical protein R2706_21145 [Acidimicrobiales bacterium]